MEHLGEILILCLIYGGGGIDGVSGKKVRTHLLLQLIQYMPTVGAFPEEVGFPLALIYSKYCC